MDPEYLDPDKELQTFLSQQPAERRQETLNRFLGCVDEILTDYRSTYKSPRDALRAAIDDGEEYAELYGENRLSLLIDQFVIQELYFRTLH